MLWKCIESLFLFSLLFLFWTKTVKFNLFVLTLLFYTEFSRSLLPRPRRLLLLVNPFSGRGQAMQWCQTHILPMIREANISYNLIQTGNTPSAKAASWGRSYIYIKHSCITHVNLINMSQSVRTMPESWSERYRSQSGTASSLFLEMACCMRWLMLLLKG